MTLAQFREKYPQYDDMTDQEVARNLHRSFYSDIPFDAFAQRIQLGAPSRKPQRVSPDQPRSLYDEVSGFASQVRASIPGSDEILGAIRGAGRAVEGFVNPTSQGGVSVMDTRDGISLQDRMTGAGNAYREGYGREVERERAQREDYASRRPVESMVAQLPAVAVAGGAVSKAAGRGGNLLMRAAAGGGAGAATGAVYGAASEGNLQQRGTNAMMSGGVGAVTGAAFPVVGRAIGTRAGLVRTPAAAVGAGGAGAAAGGAIGASMAPEGSRGEWGMNGALIGAGLGSGLALGAPAVRTAFREGAPRVNALLASRSGSLGGNTPPPGPKTRLNTIVDDEMQRMAERRGLTAEQVRQMQEEAAVTGRNPLAAQVLGEPGLQRLQTNTTLPGQSAQRAKEVIGAQRGGQVPRVSEDIDQAFGTQTRQAAQQGVDEAYQQLSPQYNELLSRTQIRPQATESINGALQRIPPTEMKSIVDAAGRIAHYDGLTFRQLPQAQQLHYIKMGLDQRIKAMGREGLAGTERQRLVVATKNLRTAMEDGIPGYKQLNGQWMDNVQTDEALSWADEFFAGGKNALRPEEIKAQFDAMSPAQQQAAMVSIRNRMLQTVEDRGRTGVRSTNVVDPFLSEGFQKRMRAVLGDKADDMMRRFRAEDRNFAELGPTLRTSGPKTANVLADGMDQMPSLSKTNLLSGAIDAVARRVTSPIFEASRNKQTERLLKEMTPEDFRALRRALRLKTRKRTRDTRNAVSDAISGGALTDQ